MEINGLPLHPLVVHAAVVLGPLSTLTALAYALVPRWRNRLRWPMVVAVLLATAAIWVAFLTGEDFKESKDFFSQGALGTKVEHHEELAGTLRLVTSGLAVVAVVAVWLHHRRGAVRIALAGLLSAAAVATLVYTVLTGESGARAVWGQS
jgi:uncharacterized membrane protein